MDFYPFIYILCLVNFHSASSNRSLPVKFSTILSLNGDKIDKIDKYYCCFNESELALEAVKSEYHATEDGLLGVKFSDGHTCADVLTYSFMRERFGPLFPVNNSHSIIAWSCTLALIFIGVLTVWSLVTYKKTDDDNNEEESTSSVEAAPEEHFVPMLITNHVIDTEIVDIRGQPSIVPKRFKALNSLLL